MKTTTKLPVTIENNSIRIGNTFSCSFQRTLRIPDDNKTYNLPPSLGTFPIKRVDDYPNTVPANWKEHGGVFIPMYQCEAMWIRFSGNPTRPNAVKVAVGMVNAISGKPWSEQLSAMENDYLVVPDQPWLDGINAGNGTIRQFVAMPLGSGVTVEGQVTGKEEFGGLQLLVFEQVPKPEPIAPTFFGQPQFSSSAITFGSAAAPPSAPSGGFSFGAASTPTGFGAAPKLDESAAAFSFGGASEMGLAAGGKMQQKIYKDKYGIDNWDQSTSGRVYIHIVNSAMYQQITGEMLPPTPVNQAIYAQYNFPWFQIYDEYKGHIAPSAILSNVQSVGSLLGNSNNVNAAPTPFVFFPTINKLDEVVEISVGGVSYFTTPRTLTSLNNSRLASYFNPSTGERANNIPLTKDQKVFIDRDGEIFSYVLNYIRTQSPECLPEDVEKLKRLAVEAQFYNLSALHQYCNQKLVAISANKSATPFVAQVPSAGMKLLKIRANNSNIKLCSANPPTPFQTVQPPQPKKVIPYSDVTFTLTSPKHILVNWYIGDSAGNHFVDVNGVEQAQWSIGSSGFNLASPPGMPIQFSYGLMANVKFFTRLGAGIYTIKLKWTPYENAQYTVNGPIITEVFEIDDNVAQVDSGFAFTS